ncbi:hypothetical protein [Lacisediminihabitans profunda]|uniref:Bacterial Ig-like domain-containing protein n=1 Tax=Lacisediminihabitans profunda TaxID=2594790 RepID=A0A5C8UU23_9MICO|nr:hypothetical protein [Lacisediminihabitans profunda]TXN31136.1 hypothetical protein FVP33_05980 [Lacisediminihabitans profunda]
MQPSPTNVPRRSFRECGASADRRFLRLAAILAFAGLAGILTAASAVPTPTSSPPASPSPNFTLTAPGFSPTDAVALTGTKDADSGVSVLPLTPGDQPVCTIPEDSKTTWGCTIALPNGRAISVTAQQLTSGAITGEDTATLDVLGAPSIDGAPGFVTSGLVSGLGFAGATVVAGVAGAPAGGCTAIASTTGYWSCALTVGSGSWVIVARQSQAGLGGGASSSPSGSLPVTVDRDAPASPTITSPRAGSRAPDRTVTYRGMGEAAGAVDVYVHNVPVCSARVSGTIWACTAAAPAAGKHPVVAIQRDQAGNFSAPSAPISVFFGPKPGAAVPPVAPTTTDPPAGTPPPSDSPTSPAPEPTPPVPPASGSSNWGTPTSFGSELPTLAETIGRGNWLLAPLLALAFILLVALPLRMLATALRGRVRRPSIRLTGRNRPGLVDRDDTTALNPILAGAIPLAVAAAFVVFSGGVDDEVRYLRLTVAVCLGLGLLNVIGVAVTTRLARRWQGVAGRLRTRPMLVLAAAVAALLSRATGIEPVVVTGVVIGIAFARGLPARPRAIVNLVEVGGVTVLAIAAWLANGALGAVQGFWPSLLHETLATIALAGLGSAMTLILPLATLPGRVILEWSPPVWLASVAVVTTLAAAVFLGGRGADFPVVGSIVVAVAFAALSLAVWAWLRFVEPVALRQPSA